MPRLQRKDRATTRPTLGETLRKAVQDSGDSIAAVARGAGIAQPVLHRFAGGERDLTLDTADRLARFLGLELRAAGWGPTLDQPPGKECDHVGQVAEHFQNAILSGKLAAGERLPSERAISNHMKVSRGVVREALGRLASLGLVTIRHGSGTRVLAPSGQPVKIGMQQLLSRPEFTLEYLAEIRLPLETTMAAMASRQRQAEHLDRLEETQRILGDPHGSLDAHIAADMAFHATLAEASGNRLLPLVLEPFHQLLIATRRRTMGRFGTAFAFKHHGHILEAVRKQDPERAAHWMRVHLEASVRQLQGGPPG
jgi:GntR family transcriptional repressor for pyruvate dehydrogenase complex